MLYPHYCSKLLLPHYSRPAWFVMTVVFSCHKIGKSKSHWKNCKRFEKRSALIPVDRPALSYVWHFVARQDPSWNFPGKTTGVGCHYLFHGIFLTQRSSPYFLHLLHSQAYFTTAPPGKLWQMCAQSLMQWPDVSHSIVNNLTANAGDAGLIPGSGRSSGGGNGYPSPLF